MKRFFIIFLFIFIINVYAESDNPFTKYKEKNPNNIFEKKSDTLKDTLETNDSIVDSAKVVIDTVKTDTNKVLKDNSLNDTIMNKIKETDKDTLKELKENKEVKKEKNTEIEEKEFDYNKFYNKGRTEAAKIYKSKDCLTRTSTTPSPDKSAWFLANSDKLTDEEIDAFSDGFYYEIEKESKDDIFSVCLLGVGCVSVTIFLIKIF